MHFLEIYLIKDNKNWLLHCTKSALCPLHQIGQNTIKRSKVLFKLFYKISMKILLKLDQKTKNTTIHVGSYKSPYIFLYATAAAFREQAWSKRLTL